MKKGLTLVFVLAVLFNMVAFADTGKIHLDITFDAEQNALSFEGYINNNRDRIPMTLMVETEGNGNRQLLYADDALAVGMEQSGVPFAFEPLVLPVTMPGTELHVTVGAAWINESLLVPYHYAGADELLIVLSQLNDFAAQNDSTSFENEIIQRTTVLGVDGSYDLLRNTAGESIALKNLMSRSYTLPADASTEENCACIKTAAAEFHQQYKEAVQLGKFFAVLSVSELSDWYDNNKIDYGFLSDDISTSVDETKMLEYFDDALKTPEFLNRRQYINNVTSMSELNIAMKHQAILQAIQDNTQHMVRTVIDDFSALLTGLDYTKWETADKDSICASLAGGRYSDISSFVTAVNYKMKTPLFDGNGGGSGGGGFVSAPKNDGNEISVGGMVPVSGAPFADLKNVAWAKDAIDVLYTRGIISGKSAAVFDPEASVTRAELIKMLVIGLNLDTTNKKWGYGDVLHDAWYAPYVAAATEKGLIKGDENGCFNPEMPISRQDAATILYRSLNVSEKASKADFNDYSEISDYAVEAVNCMYEKNIVNGMGDGRFAPNAQLSRAQAAKMLYMLLQLKQKE